MQPTFVPRPDKFCNQCDVKTWFQQFELFIGLSKTPEADKRDVLLTYLDIEIFQAVTAASKASCKYEEVKTFLLDRYSTTDIYMERLTFFEKKYSMPVESYAAQLNSCLDCFTQDIATIREELLVAKIISCAPRHVAGELRLRRPSSVSECVRIVNSLESSKDTYSCSAINKPVHRSTSKPKPTSNLLCFRCGSENHLANDAKCPAKDVTCRTCKKKGHFAAVCKSNVRPRVATVLRSTNPQVSAVARIPRPEICVEIMNRQIPFIVDTGAEVTILSKRDYEHYLSTQPLVHTRENFHNFDNSLIRMLGVIQQVDFHFNKKCANGTLYVADVPFSVLGMDVISGLRLTISAGGDSDSDDSCTTAIPPSPHVSPITRPTARPCLQIKLQEDAPPSIIQPLRRLPFALEEPVEAEIRKLLKEGVIEPIDSSPYVSPIITARKSDGSIRLCTDFRKLNKHIVVDQFPIPTPDELFSKIKNAKFFTKIDLQSAFHQIDVAEDSRDYTAFITHMGLFRYRKVPFGLASSPAVFNRILQEVLSQCQNTITPSTKSHATRQRPARRRGGNWRQIFFMINRLMEKTLFSYKRLEVFSDKK